MSAGGDSIPCFSYIPGGWFVIADTSFSWELVKLFEEVKLSSFAGLWMKSFCWVALANNDLALCDSSVAKIFGTTSNPSWFEALCR